ncbi:alpha/beta hydrolase family protein [Rhizoctonia solani]|uniref:Alpha/beta hydrolase family protein n=1 Tax=Rhizoctonia solani TaxID=456999 RepID=A0A8H8NUX4_9AGAM|nr:alpha/beta hydrolase family protein [Rhizoctonia solani]QRW19095.1 alpha/beta hydrolase family protein [Rhizoctonia solani]
MSSQLHPLGYNSKIAKLSSGHHLRYVDIHPPQGTAPIVTVLLIHGFPDSAYGWRHQVKGWSQRGIRLIVPDTIGYTGSSQPTDPQEYSMKSQSDDLEELVRQAGVSENEKIVLVAHDWQGRNHCFADGSIQTGSRERSCQSRYSIHPTVSSICSSGSTGADLSEFWISAILCIASFERGNGFKCMLPFQFIAEKFINALYSSPAKFASAEVPQFEKAGVLERWLQDQSQMTKSDILSKEASAFLVSYWAVKELDTIISQIKAGVGFSAMLNYYRTTQINYELEKDLPQEFRPDMPKLLILPTADPALPADILAQAQQGAKGVEIVWLEGAGHWLMLERPQEVESLVGEWVEKMVAQDWTI